MHYRFKTARHPLADGVKVPAGSKAKAYEVQFTLEEQGSLVLEMGQDDLCNFVIALEKMRVLLLQDRGGGSVFQCPAGLRKKPWGFTELVACCPGFDLHRISVDRGGYCSRHAHVSRRNTFIVLGGSLQIQEFTNSKCDAIKSLINIRPGDLPVSINPGTYHRFVAFENCDALELYVPVNGEPSDEDIVRVDIGGVMEFER